MIFYRESAQNNLVEFPILAGLYTIWYIFLQMLHRLSLFHNIGMHLVITTISYSWIERAEVVKEIEDACKVCRLRGRRVPGKGQTFYPHGLTAERDSRSASSRSLTLQW